MSTTLTGKNQITIPAAIVKEMKLEPGTQFDWVVGETPGTIVLKVKPSVREMLAQIQEWGRQMKKEYPDWDPMAELMKEREADLALEDQERAEFTKGQGANND